jgi:DNA-binding transcriptional ArsR family regulator
MAAQLIESGPFRLPDAPTETDLLAKYFRAFGDPTRLRILGLLEHGEASVSELVEKLGLAQPKVSNHLACLRWCGLVEGRRQHRTVYYRLADERVAGVIELGRSLRIDHEGNVAACRRIDGGAQ